MRELPILFRPEMVRKIISGYKTETRRRRSTHLAALRPGDRLWVREPWRPFKRITDCICDEPCKCPKDGTPIFAANFEDYNDRGPWKPSIFMPRSICRLWLCIEDIFEESLSEFKDADAVAEGFDSMSEFFAYWDSLGNERVGNVLVIRFTPTTPLNAAR